MGGVQDNECLESEDLMMIVLFIVLFQNQTIEYLWGGYVLHNLRLFRGPNTNGMKQ